MNEQDELARRIARLLDESADDLAPAQRERLSAARRLALVAPSGPDAGAALVPALAGGFRGFTEQRVFGVRYLDTDRRARAGAARRRVHAYRHGLERHRGHRRGTADRRAADQRLPRSGLRFMAKTLVALIVSLCIAFSAAAAQSKPDAKKAREARMDGAHARRSSRCSRRCSRNGSNSTPSGARNGSRSPIAIRR